eukprot:s256_g19.t1
MHWLKEPGAASCLSEVSAHAVGQRNKASHFIRFRRRSLMPKHPCWLMAVKWSFSGLPPALRQKAANLATWFPEVLAISGAPEEDDDDCGGENGGYPAPELSWKENFSRAHLHVSESSTSKTLEVILPKKKQPQNSEENIPASMAVLGQGIQERLERLDRLAADFESLTSQLQTLNNAAMRLQRDEAVEESLMPQHQVCSEEQMATLTHQECGFHQPKLGFHH